MSSAADHYCTLGIARSATAAEVKAAWRGLQLKWHPDRCKEPNAARRFDEVNAAYAVLGDPEARRVYDQGGSRQPLGVGVDVMVDVEIPARMAWTGGPTTVHVFHSGKWDPVDLQIPADVQVGRAWRFRGRGGPGMPPGDLILTLRRIKPDPRWRAEGLDLHGRIEVSLSDVYEGAAVTVEGPNGALRVRLPACALKPLRVRGHGRATGGRVGDLVLELDLVWPKPSHELATALRQAR